jgi:hypothetical protein
LADDAQFLPPPNPEVKNMSDPLFARVFPAQPQLFNDRIRKEHDYFFEG